MRARIATLIVAMGVVVAAAPALVLAQDGSAQDRLQSAASSLEGVQTMRFTGQTDLSSGSDTTTVFIGNGEFQAPDRGHMTANMPELSQTNETVSSGSSSWLRTVDGSWMPLGGSAPSPAPKSIADSLRQIAQYLVAPSVDDSGSQTVISGDLDVARAVSDSSPLATMIGVDYAGAPDTGTQITGSHVEVAISRATNLPVSLTTSLSMIPGAPQPGASGGPITVMTSLTMSDFNSADISVEVPSE
ncbi:MAG TPA: hypothetical protein VFC51_10645 [Chloroflexota bacterium]|nr:hypothetical protein [Chloroflexota bacterium]